MIESLYHTGGASDETAYMPIFHPYTYNKGISKGNIETSTIPWGETEDGYNDYKEEFLCGTLKEVRFTAIELENTHFFLILFVK